MAKCNRDCKQIQARNPQTTLILLPVPFRTPGIK